MAGISTQTTSRKTRGVRKAKKLSTRVDLTPMVDLGFLLITFFIYSTTMSKPKAMPLRLPADGNPSPTKASAALTLIPVKDNRVYYYEGIDPTKGTTAPIRNIRTILLDKKLRTDTAWFQVIIKPTSDATFGNTVTLLDEMKIDDIHHYVLTDPTPYEISIVKSRASKYPS
jgi:biopolymer transport protein ExbD